MGFLDNSGDIILDVVLTDHGRMLLAKGDGSFQITKFALSDEEIDYSLYDKNHASGSAYYDLEILQTPILEAFTNNSSTMKTRLQTYTNMELLFLPVLRLNEGVSINKLAIETGVSGTFAIPVNGETEDNNGSSSTTGIGRNTDGSIKQGFLFGESLIGTVIKVDQGLDTTEISPKRRLDDELKETSYTIQMDNRLCKLVDTQGTLATFDYLDDDNIAYYTVDLGDTFVTEITDDTVSASQVIQGPRGTSLEFRLQSSMDLNTSSFLFEQLGGQVSIDMQDGNPDTDVKFIDSNIRVVGVKTGVMIDIPVRFLRQ
tara:strand:- start:1000 stop:1944 length:945 start_codon:yes stop_codon:yes gene_type:complete